MTVPVHIISGFLGVGKTTAIRHAFQYRPQGAKWAVLVNEFGEVGLDGLTLDSDDGYVVKEIAGGCICCTAGPLLKVSLARLLREERPDRVFIEPTGLAHPGTIIDILRSPGIREHIELYATIGLVHPKHLQNKRYLQHETYQDQIQMADILVANFWDEASDAEQAHFESYVQSLYPPKLSHYHTQNGVLEWQWFTTSPEVHEVRRHETHHEHPAPEDPNTPPNPLPTGRSAHQLDGIATCGWVFPTPYIFDRHALLEVLQELLHPTDTRQQGALRLKGVFRTKRSWLLINGSPDMLHVEAINYRRDSRVELIIDTEYPRWSQIEEQFKEAVCFGRS